MYGNIPAFGIDPLIELREIQFFELLVETLPVPLGEGLFDVGQERFWRFSTLRAPALLIHGELLLYIT
jgi:hypothetical protein